MSRPPNQPSGRQVPPLALSATARGRAVMLLLVTAAVVACFAVLALIDPSWGGKPRGGTAALGAAIFAVPLAFLWLASRRIPAGREAAAGKQQRRPGALATVAAVLWAMAGVFWYLTFAGLDARWSVDPILLAVPLTIYPFLAFLARTTQSARRLEEPGT